MRKENKIFLLGMLIIVSLVASACQISASEGVVTPQPNDQLDDILDAVANQTPVSPTDGTGGGGDGTDSETDTSTDAVPDPPIPEPTKEPTATPEPTKPPVQVDKTVPSQYTLKKGEFPWCIARRFNVDPVGLLNANGIPVGQSQFSAGLVLKIPTNVGAYDGNRALRNHPGTYNVKSGDSFYSIACYYGDLWPEEIASYNDMDLGDPLPAGTKLNIP